MDLDRYDSLKEMLEEHVEQDTQAEILETLKKSWTCVECSEGHLEIILYNKIDSTWYYRKCTNCPHRTKSQKYSPAVQGIIKKVATDA